MHRLEVLRTKVRTSQLVVDCCAGQVLQSYLLGSTASGDATVEIGTSAVATAWPVTVTVDDAVEIGASAIATAHAVTVTVDATVEIGASAIATAHDVTVTTAADATVEIGASAIATAHAVTVVVDASVEIGASATATAWPVTVMVQDRPAVNDSSLRYAVVRPTYRELVTDRRVADSRARATDRIAKATELRMTDNNVTRRNVAMSARAQGSRVGTVSRTSRTL